MINLTVSPSSLLPAKTARRAQLLSEDSLDEVQIGVVDYKPRSRTAAD